MNKLTYNVIEAALITGLSISGIRKRCRTGYYKTAELCGCGQQSWLISAEELHRLMNSLAPQQEKNQA